MNYKNLSLHFMGLVVVKSVANWVVCKRLQGRQQQVSSVRSAQQHCLQSSTFTYPPTPTTRVFISARWVCSLRRCSERNTTIWNYLMIHSQSSLFKGTGGSDAATTLRNGPDLPRAFPPFDAPDSLVELTSFGSYSLRKKNIQKA